MNELNDTLKDIARTQAPTFPKLRKAVRVTIEFSRFVDEAPCFGSIDWHDQVLLMEAALADCIDAGEFAEFEEYFRQRMSLKPETVKDVIRHRTGVEASVNVIFDNSFSDLVSLFRAAAYMYFEDTIETVLSEEYRDYCSTYGIYSPDSDSGPGELKGFRGD